MKRLAIPPLIAALLVAMAVLPAVADEHDAVEITLIHDTHLHGSFGDDEPGDSACPDGADAAGFEDVPSTNVHDANIDCAVSVEILQGTSTDPLRFTPAGFLTRGQVATMLAGALTASGVDLPDDADQPFTDAGATHGDAIAALHAVGIVEGFVDGTYGPGLEVRRDQLASLLVRAVGMALDEDLGTGDDTQFDDVPSTNVHADNILAAREHGLMIGRTETTFEPAGNARRDQAASTVVRLADHVTPTGPSTVNIGRYMALVEELKAANSDALFIGNGDDIAPSVLASVFGGEHMIEALNASPMDYNTMGNHEFDFGPDNLRERLEESEFQWVSANVRDQDNTSQPFGHDLGVELFAIEEIEGVNVGITGLGPQGMGTVTSLTSANDTSGAEHVDMVDAMEEVIPQMQSAGADIIVVGSHLCGSDARTLADAVDGIDAIVGDHCSEVLDEPEVINDTILSFVGDEYDFVGELTIEVAGGAVADHSFTLHDVTRVRAPDTTIQEIVDRWEADLDEALSEEIGFRTNDWDVQTTAVRSGETGFANYIVDAMREQVDADVGLTNGGGIRSDQIYEGDEPIILRDVQAILPFGNTVVMVEVSGATILEALEHGLAEGTPQGRFPQVSGMAYVWDPDAPSGERVTQVTIDGDPLDESADYTLATNDFMLGGGDGYEMLAEGDVVISPEGAQPMMDAVIDKIRDDENVTVEIDGRITTD